MRKLLLAIVATLILSGCGTTAALTQEDLAQPLRHGEARIAISRDDSALYFAAGAVVHINNQEFATLARGGGTAKDVPAGDATVAVLVPEFGILTLPGSCAGQMFVVSFKAKPGKTYKFMVSPRQASYRQSDFLRNAAFGPVGSAMMAKVSNDGGCFQIVPVQ